MKRFIFIKYNFLNKCSELWTVKVSVIYIEILIKALIFIKSYNVQNNIQTFEFEKFVWRLLRKKSSLFIFFSIAVIRSSFTKNPKLTGLLCSWNLVLFSPESSNIQ